MNKKQKAIVLFWAVLTAVVGIYAAFYIASNDLYYRNDPNFVARFVLMEGRVVLWLTATLVLAALWAVFADKKSN